MTQLMVREARLTNLFLFKNFILVYGEYTLISRFSRSTKNALPPGKPSCYSPFHFKADLANTDLTF